MSILFSIIGIVFILYIIEQVKKNQFAEAKSIFWVFGGIIILVLALFPVIVVKIAWLLGIVYPPSLLFLLSILFVLFVTFRQEQEISLLNERVKELAQRNAILDQEVRNLTRIQNATPPPSLGPSDEHE